MDSLLETFNSSVNVSFDESATFAKHPRYNLYKQAGTKNRQEERRKELLKEQKEKKIKVINVKRGIVKQEVVKEIEKELMDCVSTLPKNKRAYKDVLMLSEWLIDVPDDFFDKWIVVPCPVGKRVLVVAEKGGTIAYARKGFRVLHKFSSGLPGGSRNQGGKSLKNATTRLDGIWNEATRTLYIIDALELGPNLVDCECDFRFMWLEWKFDEYRQEIDEGSKNYKIELLDRFRASQLHEYVKNPINRDFKIDGLLFFHEEGLYEEFTKSPLVTWLKPYMVSEILNLETHPDYLADKPPEVDPHPKYSDVEEKPSPVIDEHYPEINSERLVYSEETNDRVFTHDVRSIPYALPQPMYPSEIPYVQPPLPPHMYQEVPHQSYVYTSSMPPHYAFTEVPQNQYLYQTLPLPFIPPPVGSFHYVKPAINQSNKLLKRSRKFSDDARFRTDVDNHLRPRYLYNHEPKVSIPVVSAKDGHELSRRPPPNSKYHSCKYLKTTPARKATPTLDHVSTKEQEQGESSDSYDYESEL